MELPERGLGLGVHETSNTLEHQGTGIERIHMHQCNLTIMNSYIVIFLAFTPFGCQQAQRHEAPKLVTSVSPAAHGYDPTRYASNAPPATCPTPMSSSGDCMPFPDCATNSIANCIAIDATHNVCNYFPDKGRPECNCFKGQVDFCFMDGSPARLGVRKCQVSTNGTITTYQWTACTSPGTVP